MNTLDLDTVARKASLADLVALLHQQRDVSYDAVIPASRLRYENGRLHVRDGAVRFTDTPTEGLGAANCDAVLAPTDVFEDGVADRLGIPRKYLRTLRSTGVRVTGVHETFDLLVGRDRHPFDLALLDANVNGWLQSLGDKPFLVRAFRTDDPDSVGIARAFLSDRFALGLDNLDMLVAVLAGVHEAGLDPTGLTIESNLSERGMRVNITATEVQALAPHLLRNYRSPFSGLSGADLPVVWAGLSIGNSETGGGAFTITPRVVFQVCTNGLTKKVDALREVHLGARLQEGIVRVSADTVEKQKSLITARARDAVATFLDVDYVQSVLDGIAEKAGVKVNDAVATITKVAKVHAFSDAEQASILDCFIKGGDTTAFGVVQAVTAAAQGVDDPDRACELEDVALDVLDTAVAAQV